MPIGRVRLACCSYSKAFVYMVFSLFFSRIVSERNGIQRLKSWFDSSPKFTFRHQPNLR